MPGGEAGFAFKYTTSWRLPFLFNSVLFKVGLSMLCSWILLVMFFHLIHMSCLGAGDLLTWISTLNDQHVSSMVLLHQSSIQGIAALRVTF